MIRWRGGRRSKTPNKRSQLQAYLTAPSLDLNPGDNSTRRQVTNLDWTTRILNLDNSLDHSSQRYITVPMHLQHCQFLELSPTSAKLAKTVGPIIHSTNPVRVKLRLAS